MHASNSPPGVGAGQAGSPGGFEERERFWTTAARSPTFAFMNGIQSALGQQLRPSTRSGLVRHVGLIATVATVCLVPTGAATSPATDHDKAAMPKAADKERRPPPVAGGRALPPSVGGLLEAAFGRMAPQLSLNSASIQGDRVDAEICQDVATRKGCYKLALSDPEQACSGEVVGAWCLIWQGAPPASELLAKARTALAADPPDKVWRTVSAEPPVSRQEDDATPPVGLALLVILGALLGGALAAGAVGRRMAGTGRVLLWCLVVGLPWAGLWPPAGSVPSLGAWDWLVFALLWDLGALLALAWSLADGGVRLALGLAIGLAALAGGAELLVDSPGGDDETANVHWQAEGTGRRACQLIFDGDAESGDNPFSTAHDQARPVVHFGSGLLYGEGWAARDELRRNLEQHVAGSRHVIAGLGRGASDFQLLALRSLLPRHPVEAVVLHLAAEKDVAEMDAPLACCDAGPLLAYAEAEPTTDVGSPPRSTLLTPPPLPK